MVAAARMRPALEAPDRPALHWPTNQQSSSPTGPRSRMAALAVASPTRLGKLTRVAGARVRSNSRKLRKSQYKLERRMQLSFT